MYTAAEYEQIYYCCFSKRMQSTVYIVICQNYRQKPRPDTMGAEDGKKWETEKLELDPSSHIYIYIYIVKRIHSHRLVLDCALSRQGAIHTESSFDE